MEPPEAPSGQVGGVEEHATPTPVDVDTAVLLLGAGVTAITHPLLYVKLLIQVGHEPLPPSVGTTMFGRRVLYLPGFFSYVMSLRCMAQFVGREVTYSGMFSCIVKIFKEEGVAGFYSGLIPHVVGEVLFLWCCNLLAHFINTYAVDESFSQAPAVRSYTKFVMGIAVNVLTYPFMLVADLMAVNNCGLAAGLPPHSPVFKSWLHCWNHLSHKVRPASPLSFCSFRDSIPRTYTEHTHVTVINSSSAVCRAAGEAVTTKQQLVKPRGESCTRKYESFYNSASVA
ncbi:Mitochondrial carrier-like protein 1 [Nibea albiflora]|uniref:Mitochondrial carrier-like protein 1 n=1 Tax=Nibea albiflora TaxID=240163 RepID=A0ACB7EL47_NIBAL|nr:Mitochondrial carrier-like protein 1 [Nibea albiflora]